MIEKNFFIIKVLVDVSFYSTLKLIIFSSENFLKYKHMIIIAPEIYKCNFTLKKLLQKFDNKPA